MKYIKQLQESVARLEKAKTERDNYGKEYYKNHKDKWNIYHKNRVSNNKGKVSNNNGKVLNKGTKALADYLQKING